MTPIYVVSLGDRPPIEIRHRSRYERDDSVSHPLRRETDTQQQVKTLHRPLTTKSERSFESEHEDYHLSVSRGPEEGQVGCPRRCGRFCFDGHLHLQELVPVAKCFQPRHQAVQRPNAETY